MKTVSIALAAHLATNATSLADCLWLERVDGQVFTFTTHDQDLEIDGLTYATAPGILGAALASKPGMEVDNTDVTGLFDAAGITLDDIRSGDWDHASFRLFRVNWADVTQGELKAMKGKLGRFTTHSHLMVELRGLAYGLQATIGLLVAPACPWDLGDTNCGVDLTLYTTAGEVTSVADNRAFDTDLASSSVSLDGSTDLAAPTADYFVGGVLTWLTGANADRSEVVKLYAVDGSVELQLPMYSTIVAGDTFSVHAGCGKTRLADCRDRFDNVLNFGGFDLLPGQEVTMKFGGQ